MTTGGDEQPVGLSESELYEVIESAMDLAEIGGLDPMSALKHVIAAAIGANNARLSEQVAASGPRPSS